MKPIEDNNAFLMAMGEGSRIEIHAVDAEKESWTQINQTASSGDLTLVLSEETGWQIGDKIAIASTGFDMDEAEYRTITDVSADGLTITLDAELEHDHFGEVEMHNNGLEGDAYQSWELDMRAEVALLSRNVTIQGDEDASDDGYGGHTMIMDGASMHIDGAELTKMGQIGEVGRYPLHWHMLDDGSGQYVTNSSIHETYNKGMTIHGTKNTWVEDNVVVNTLGHGYYFEDGSESGNVLIDNLGMNTVKFLVDDLGMNNVKAASIAAAPIATDHTEVSTYWVTNPDNHLVGNHAAGSDDTGFWILSQDHTEGKSAEDDRFSSVVPREANPGTWSGNVAHSNADDGFWIGSQFNEENGDKTEPKLEVPFLLEDFTTFKNEGWGIWMRNANGDFEDLKIADSNAGIQMWGHSNVSDSLFVGRTGNADDTLAQHVGWQPYDDSVKVADTHFTGFTGDDDTAISNGWGFGRAVNHVVEGLTFGDDVKNKFLNTLVNEKFGGFTQIDGRNISDQGGPIAGGIIDADGSLTGIAGATLTPALIDFIPNKHVDVVVDGDPSTVASGFNYTDGAVWLEDAQAWVHQPDTVIGKMDIVQKKLVDTNDENQNDYNILGENGEIVGRRTVQNVTQEERVEYTITRSDNGASLAIGEDAMVSYAWHTQLNVDTSDGVEYIVEYTDALPEALTIELTQMLEGSTAYYRFKGLPENVTFQQANAAASIEEFNAATATTWFREDNGDYVVKAFADTFLPWKGLPRNDSEASQERIYTDEFKLFIKDAETIEAKPNGFFNPEPDAWTEATPTPVPERASSTSKTVEIEDSDPRWSDSASWDNDVPGADDIVIIGAGQRMVLDQDVTVKAILVNGGELIVEDTKDVSLSSDWILVVEGGLFQVGTEDNPFEHDFDLTLEGDDRENDVDMMALMMSTDENIVRAVDAEDPVDPETPVRVTVVDENNSKRWSEYTDTFDENGVISQREMIYDNGRVLTTEYSNGVKVSEINEDLGDAYKWASQTKTYAMDAEGQKTAHDVIYDNGRVTEVEYRNGDKVRSVTEDLGDAYNWSSITKTYRLDELASSVKVADNGTITSSTYALGGGPRIQLSQTDAGDNYSWYRKVTKYDGEGQKTGREISYDDGRVATTEYVDGVRKSLEIIDAADAFDWHVKSWEYDENGKFASKDVIYDFELEVSDTTQPALSEELTDVEEQSLPLAAISVDEFAFA